MIQTGSTQASHVCRDVTKTKRLVRLLAHGSDDQVRTRIVLPDQPWASRIYTPELFGQTLGHVSVFTTNSGTCEGRIYMEGSDCIVGIAYEKVPGATFLEKRRSIVSMSPESIEGLCKDAGGFQAVLTASDNKAVIIPSGHIIISASQGSCYYRWGIASDTMDTGRVKCMLQNITDSFPEFKNPSYPVVAFADFLNDHIG